MLFGNAKVDGQGSPLTVRPVSDAKSVKPILLSELIKLSELQKLWTLDNIIQVHFFYSDLSRLPSVQIAKIPKKTRKQAKIQNPHKFRDFHFDRNNDTFNLVIDHLPFKMVI